MLQLKKPPRLHRGDKVATVSLSWGAAGSPDIRWRYELGKRRMETLFGLQVVEMPQYMPLPPFSIGRAKWFLVPMASSFLTGAVRPIRLKSSPQALLPTAMHSWTPPGSTPWVSPTSTSPR